MRDSAMIKVKCSGCGKIIKAGDDWAGRQGNCPGCGTPAKFPTVSPHGEPEAIVPVLPARAESASVDALVPLAAKASPPPASIFDDVFDKQVDEHQHCPYCGEKILRRAIKCRYCNEFLDGRGQAKPEAAQEITVTTIVPTAVHYDRQTDIFTGTMVLMVKLAMRAVQELGWKLEQANETIGLVTFETGISWGSWSGVSCSLNVEEVSQNKFRVKGTGKQSVRGGQILALNIGGEAQGKARKAIDMMKRLAT